MSICNIIVSTYQINMLTLTWVCWVSNKIRLHVDINMLHVKSIACWHNIMSHVSIIMLHVDIIYIPCSWRGQKYTTIHSQDDSFCQPNQLIRLLNVYLTFLQTSFGYNVFQKSYKSDTLTIAGKLLYFTDYSITC